MAYEAEGLVGAVEGTAGVMLGSLFAGMAQSRQRAANARANRIACTAAAVGARAQVLSGTVQQLQARLEDALDDAADAEDRIAVLQAQVARLMSDRQTLADALRQARRAA